MRQHNAITLVVLATVIATAATIAACADGIAGPSQTPDFEVWAVDQSPSPGKAFGGLIHIFRDSTLPGGGGAHTLTSATERVDLSGATAQLCQSATGALPVQAHNITFNRSQTHAMVAFLTSGHVAILNAATREPVACLQMSLGTSGMRHAHQAVAAPDGSYILVANQMGKLLERIDADFVRNSFAKNTAATLNLATCLTPSGVACEAAGVRPNNQPVTVTIDQSGSLAFVTLRGGGFFVIDPRSTPMRIVAEYDMNTIQPQGLASIRVGDALFSTSGANAFRLYRFALSDFASGGAASTRAANQPAATALISEGTTGRDGHGLALTGDDRYLWATDRGGNVIEVFDVRAASRVGTINLVGPLTSDPSPDILGTSPRGDLVFVTLKGPNPLSGIPWGTGITPGVGVIEVDDGGRSGRLIAIQPISNRDANNVERADPHGLAVRVR